MLEKLKKSKFEKKSYFCKMKKKKSSTPKNNFRQTTIADSALNTLYSQARQFLDAGHLPQAALAIHRAAALAPKDPEISKLCKHINDKLYSYFSQLIRLHPNEPQHYLDRGELYLRQGTVAKALADYNRAIALLTDTIQEHPRMKKPYFDRAYAYSTLELYTKAVDDYSTLLRLYPNDQPARFNRAIAYYRMGQYPLAVDDLTHCIHLAPNAACYQFRAFAYFSQGLYIDAIDDFTRVLHLSPTLDNSEILYYRGLAFFHTGALPQALDDLTQCLPNLADKDNRVNACLVIDTCRTRLSHN